MTLVCCPGMGKMYPTFGWCMPRCAAMADGPVKWCTQSTIRRCARITMQYKLRWALHGAPLNGTVARVPLTAVLLRSTCDTTVEECRRSWYGPWSNTRRQVTKQRHELELRWLYSDFTSTWSERLTISVVIHIMHGASMRIRYWQKDPACAKQANRKVKH